MLYHYIWYTIRMYRVYSFRAGGSVPGRCLELLILGSLWQTFSPWEGSTHQSSSSSGWWCSTPAPIHGGWTHPQYHSRYRTLPARTVWSHHPCWVVWFGCPPSCVLGPWQGGEPGTSRSPSMAHTPPHWRGSVWLLPHQSRILRQIWWRGRTGNQLVTLYPTDNLGKTGWTPKKISGILGMSLSSLNSLLKLKKRHPSYSVDFFSSSCFIAWFLLWFCKLVVLKQIVTKHTRGTQVLPLNE